MIVGGIVVWAGMVWSMSSFVSGWTNYSLSLAGVTGIIVAIGVTVEGDAEIGAVFDDRSGHE